jgi:anti-sigma factor (TIGR02949 family)
MISCTEAVRDLWEFLDSTLTADGRGNVEEHLARCRNCCGELEFARELRLMLATTATGDLPEDVLRRLHQMIEELDT